MVAQDYDGNIELNQPNVYEKWEEKFRCWSQPPSKDIQREFGRQIRILRNCVLKSTSDRERLGLDKDVIEVSTQGSYRASTNIEGSDIDIIIRLVKPIACDSQKTDLSQLDDWKAKFSKLNEFVEKLLIRRFGEENVERLPWGYFKVHEQCSGVTIEVMPTVRSGEVQEWITDDGEHVRDSFKRVDANRTKKHAMTGKRFKKVMRVFKHLLYEMKKSDDEKYGHIKSYILEATIYNVPNYIFNQEKMVDIIKSILEYGIKQTRDAETCEQWKKLDGINYVFRGSQCLDRQVVCGLLLDIWNSIGFSKIEDGE
jgi:hypothetical protein